MSRSCLAGKRYTYKRRFIHSLWGERCAYCGEIGELNIDHIVPITLGGTNSLNNLCPSCLRCNNHKHDKSIQDFLCDQDDAMDILLFAYHLSLFIKQIFEDGQEKRLWGKNELWIYLENKLSKIETKEIYKSN